MSRAYLGDDGVALVDGEAVFEEVCEERVDAGVPAAFLENGLDMFEATNMMSK